MRDVRIGDLDRASPGEVWLCGRVTEIVKEHGETQAVLEDDSGRATLRGSPIDDSCGVGALLAVRGRAVEGTFLASEVRVLSAPAGFPTAEQRRLGSVAMRSALVARGRLNQSLRRYFEEQGFIEVETGQLVSEPGQEPTLDPFRCGDRTLITSPELRMKRLLVAGYERIFELSHAFRSGAGERSRWHHPEFSMLEWYRAFETEDALIADLEALLARTAREVGGRPVVRRDGTEIALTAPFERITVAQAFSRHAGVDLDPFLDGDAAGFRESARAAGVVAVADDDDPTSLFFRILIDRVEPALGATRPTVLTRFPASMAALAAVDGEDPRCARRFELYVAGVELGNAFFELTDPVEQRDRFERERREKRADGRDPGPLPVRFLEAMAAGMPPASGIAFGVDRWLMLILGAERIDDVLPFPDESPGAEAGS